MKYRAIKHAFVQFIPDTLDGGTVYVSIPFATADALSSRRLETRPARPASGSPSCAIVRDHFAMECIWPVGSKTSPDCGATA